MTADAPTAAGVPRVPAGLCGACVHTRVIEARGGSRFHLCTRSRTDPSFPRYPALPVLRCAGFESATHPRPADAGQANRQEDRA